MSAERDERRVLILLRHAKSDYPAAVADHDRPLAPRGEREAALAGEWLYGATPGAVIDEINRGGDDVPSLLVVGHEPAMSQLAIGLSDAESSNPAAVERIITKYPTSAMAVLRVDGPWSALALGGAALMTFYVPR